MRSTSAAKNSRENRAKMGVEIKVNTRKEKEKESHVKPRPKKDKKGNCGTAVVKREAKKNAKWELTHWKEKQTHK